MRILILDPYSDQPHRISKDTIGGYGTANRFGDGLVSRAITWFMARQIDWPPIYSVYTAGVLRAQGHDVFYARTFPTSAEFELCLMTSSIVCHETEVEAALEVAQAGIPVGMIGPFASSVPEPYLKAGAFVVGGEPEMYFMNNLVDTETVRELDGMLPASPAVDLDELPRPAWDIIFDVAQPKFGLLGGKERMLPLHATRGCPYSCFHYCAYPLQQGRVVRLRAPEKIVEEMEYWHDTLGVTIFVFRDPVFSINRKHTLALCDALDQSDHQFKFVVETHLKNLDHELARRLRSVGLDMVKIGIESVNEEAIETSKRYTIDQEQQIERISMLENLGVKITSFYMLGMPNDTAQNFEATMRYARRLNTLFAQISVFTPYPGTPAFKEFEPKIVVDRYEEFTQYDLIYRNDQFTPKQIRRLLSRAYRNYYSRPRWMLKYLAARAS